MLWFFSPSALLLILACLPEPSMVSAACSAASLIVGLLDLEVPPLYGFPSPALAKHGLSL